MLPSPIRIVPAVLALFVKLLSLNPVLYKCKKPTLSGGLLWALNRLDRANPLNIFLYNVSPPRHQYKTKIVKISLQPNKSLFILGVRTVLTHLL